MKTLNRKLVRDLLLMKGQVAAICLVIAAWVATFVMVLTAHESLQRALNGYYDRYQFANVFDHVKRAPNSLVERIRRIPGVAEVQTRIVADVNLDVAGLADARPATDLIVR